MKLKKVLAFVVTGAMMLTIPVVASLADPIPVKANEIQPKEDVTASPAASESPAASTTPAASESPAASTTPGSGSSSGSSSSTTPSTPSVIPPVVSEVVSEPAPIEQYDKGAEDFVLATKVAGIPLEVSIAAEEQGKTISEYMTNSIQTLPGLDEVTPVGQGGNVIIDGEASNVTFALDKPLNAHVDFAKTQAASINGKVMNVVNVKTNVLFGSATVNFYAPGVVVGQNIQVFQYVNGEWVSVDVSEIRDDHIVVNMTAPGVLAFIEVQ